MKEEQERTPLRTILQNFLNHIEKLDSQKVEGSYDKEFQELKLFSEILKTSKQFSCSQGEKEVNRKKNRYKDILPFDESRVILDGYAGVPGSDYINANYIKGASGSPAYIASQGPLPHTVNDFWRMVVECEVQVIVMACNEEEAGKHKCENYWVEREGEEKQFGMVAIRLIKASVVCPDFLVRTMRLKYTNSQSSIEERTVCQFHYSAWPDHGVPPLVRPLLDMVRLVRDTQASETLPVLVHCSAGCGRTGTICAIDYVWGLLRAGKLTKDFSLFKLVRDMRRQRIAMVQTKEQYILVHHAVKELFCEQLRMIDSHPYENIDVNGMPLVKESPEPMYATITTENVSEEKQDNKEKEGSVNGEVDASPLPYKKKLHTASSKQEKEVENLTEKQRSIVEQSSSSDTGSGSSVGSLLQKPRIAKLKALFERSSLNRESRNTQSKHRTSQQVVRSHSLGAVRKVEDTVQPIPCKGILRVPQLSTVHGPPSRPVRPALPIKRSKSLKVLGSGERYKLSVVADEKSSPLRIATSRNLSEVNRNEEGSSAKTVGLLHHVGSVDALVKYKFPSDSKPTIPPKKFPKDKLISDRRPVLSSSTDGKVLSQQYVNVGFTPPKSSEATQLVVAPINTVHSRRRRSLESFTSDDVSTLSQSNVNRVQPSCINSQRVVPSHLEKEAQKLWQDCSDYLKNSAKSDVQDKSGIKEHDGEVRNSEHLQNFTVDAQRKINAIVAGLGVRERRNSFRQAINTSKNRDVEASGSNVREYEAIWLVKNTSHNTSSAQAANVLGRKVTNGPCLSKVNLLSKSSSLCDTPYIPYQVAFSGSRNKLQKAEQCSEMGIMERNKHLIKDSIGKCPTSIRTKVSHCGEFPKDTELGSPIVNSEVGRFNQPEYPQKKQNLNLQRRGNVAFNAGKPGVPLKTTRPDMWPVVMQPSVRTNAAGTCRMEKPGGMSGAIGDTREDLRKLGIASSRPMQHQSGMKFQDHKNVSRKVNMSEAVPVIWPNVIIMDPSDKIPNIRKPDMSEGLGINHSDSACSSETSVEPKNDISRVCTESRELNIQEAATSLQEAAAVKSVLSPRNCQVYTSLPDTKFRTCEGKPFNHNALKVRNVCSQSKETSERVLEERNVVAGRRNHRERIQEPVAPRRDEGEPSRPAVPGPALKIPSPSETDVVSYGLVAGVQLRRGSRDDLALCGAGPTIPPRVRRHASVVLLRHSLIEASDGTPMAPLTVWNSPQSGSGETSNRCTSIHQKSEAWGGAPGVDLDTIAASIKPSRSDQGTPLMRTLEALHLRKSSARSVPVSPPQHSFQLAQTSAVKKQHYL